MSSDVDNCSSFESVLLSQLQELRARVVAEHRRQIQAVLNHGKLGQAAKNNGQFSPTAWESGPMEMMPSASIDSADSAESVRSSLVVDEAQSDNDLDFMSPDAPVAEEMPQPPPSKPPVIVTTTQVQQLSPSPGGLATPGLMQDIALQGTLRPSISAPAGQSEPTTIVPPGNSLMMPQLMKSPSQAARIAAIQRGAQSNSRSGTPEDAEPNGAEGEVQDRGEEVDSNGSVGELKLNAQRSSLDSTTSTAIQIPEAARLERPSAMVSLAVPSALKDGRRSNSKLQSLDVNSGFRLRSNSKNESPAPGVSLPCYNGTRRSNREDEKRESILRIQPNPPSRSPSIGGATIFNPPDIVPSARACSFRLDEDIYSGDGNFLEGRTSYVPRSSRASIASRRDSRFSAFCEERVESRSNRRNGSIGGSKLIRDSQISGISGGAALLAQMSDEKDDEDEERRSRVGTPDEGLQVTRFNSFLSDASMLSDAGQHYEVLSIWYIRKGRKSEKTTKNKIDRKDTAFEERREDDEDHTGMARCMIPPGSRKNVMWDVLFLLLIGWDCFSIPLQWFSPEETSFSTSVAWITRLYWTFNMAVSFFIGFIDSQGAVCMQPAQVAKRYLLTWFVLDLLTVGSDWAEVATTARSTYFTWGTTLRSIRVLRTVRLLRLFRAPIVWRYFSEQIRSEELILVAQLCKMMVLMLVTAHFIACGWYGLGDAGYDGSWLEVSEEADGGAIREKELALRYTMSMHWSLSMLTGETLITGTNLAERTYTCTVLFFAFMFSAFLVSSITTSMTRLEIMSRQQSQQLMQLRRYLVDNSISRKLSVRVQRNAQHVMVEQKRNLQEEKVDLLKVISGPLLVELHYEVHSRVVMEHPFFCCFNEVSPAGIRKVCHLAVSLLRLSAGDILFSDCETPTNLRMFFPMNGRIIYKKAGTMGASEEGEDHDVVTLHHDQWMCEGVLWTSWCHCGTLQAKTESRLLVVDANQFHNICIATPMVQISKYAEAFVDVLNMTDKGTHSDVGEFDAFMEDMIAYSFPELIYEDEVQQHEAEGMGKFHMLRNSGNLAARNSANSHRSMTSWRSPMPESVLRMVSISSKRFVRRSTNDEPHHSGHHDKKLRDHKMLKGATNHNLNALMRHKQHRWFWWFDELLEMVREVRLFPKYLINSCCSKFKGRGVSTRSSIMVCPAPSSDAEMVPAASAISCATTDSARQSVTFVEGRQSVVAPLNPNSNLRVSSAPVSDAVAKPASEAVDIADCP